MNKRFLSITSLLTLALPNAQAEENFRTGYYSGMNVGASLSHMTVKNQLNFSPLNGDPADQKFGKGSSKKFGGAAEVLAGYRIAQPGDYNWSQNCLLGIEAAIQQHFSKNRNLMMPFKPSFFTSQTFKHNFTGVLQVTMGYAIRENFMLFIKAGPAFTHFSLTHKTYNSSRKLVGNERRNKRKFGTTLSLGSEYALNSEWSLTGTLTHNFYPKITFKMQKDIAPIPSNESQTVKIKPTYTALKLGFVYRY